MSQSTKFSCLPRRLALALMICGLVAAVGCGGQAGDDTPSDDSAVGTYALQDTEHTRNVRVFDNVKRLDERAAHAVYIVDAETLVFPKTVADILAAYEPGDIMATSAGEGLLRRVERIDRGGDQIVVHTSPASLAEVFASGEIYVASHAEPDLEVPESFRYQPQEIPAGGDFQVRQQRLEVDWSDSLFSWDQDFASELNTHISNALGTSNRLIVEEASLSTEIGGEFYANAGASVFPPSFELKTVRAGANGIANTTLRLRVQSEDAFSFEHTYYIASTDPSHDAFKTLSEKTADIAGLVQLSFNANSRIDLSAAVEGKVTATGEVQVNGNLHGGIERKSGVWQAYKNAGLSPSGYAPEFDGEKNFWARAVLETTMTVEVSDTVNGSLVVKPATITADLRQDINAANGQCPYYFNVNVRGDVSGQLESISVAGFEVSIMDSPSKWTIYDQDLVTKEGQIELPGICDPDYVPPSFGDGGHSAGMTCKHADACDSGMTCFRESCVTQGPIRFSVAWFEDTDADIQVTTPSGEVVDWRSFTNGETAGLLYDFPQCTAKCTGPGPYVENIYSRVAPQPGTYTIEIFHQEARNDSDFALLIEHDGEVHHDGGKLPAEGESVSFEYTVD